MVVSGRLAARIALLLAFLLGAFYLATERLARPWVVHGASMEPSLADGDRVVVDLWTLRQRPPRDGEVVLLRGPLSLPSTLVKRVAPTPPGEDRPRPREWPGSRRDRGIWVVGDNRPMSEDSRHFGAVPRDRVVGRVIFRYWPLSRIGPVDGTRVERATLPVR